MSPNWLSLFEKSEGQSGSSQAFLFKPPFLVYISNSSSITKTEIYHPAPVSQADFFISQVSDVRCSNCRARQPMPSNICETQFSWSSSKSSDLKVNYQGFCILHFALHCHIGSVLSDPSSTGSTPGPRSLSLDVSNWLHTRCFWDLTDVTLADEDTNSNWWCQQDNPKQYPIKVAPPNS